jgi:hypothetical protein
MTTTPNEPVRDDDIETAGAGLGSAAAPGATGPDDGTRDGAEGGPLDTQDADGSDADSTDADGSDADGTDA